MNFLGLTPTPAPHTWQGRGGGRFSVTPTPVSVSKIDYDSDCDSGHSCRLQPIPTSASTPTPTPQPCIFINLKASVVARAMWKVKGAQILFLKYRAFERPIVKVFQKDIYYYISYQRWGKGVGGLDVSCVFRRYWVKKKKTAAQSKTVFATPINASFPHILWKFQAHASQGQVTR